ncbi:hypothetical protein [Paenibacillus tarimensis]|uniref:hypothetical protein n=1 Tax=Paenibacillus tarimensis TaxID=416012 RepID=UPI001F3B276D|nr:hypothetical protein [Paenibacillus tarimensis]MCF2943386.1 hypothetical protein [Paenibacillus tarimensis]
MRTRNPIPKYLLVLIVVSLLVLVSMLLLNFSVILSFLAGLSVGGWLLLALVIVLSIIYFRFGLL